MTGKIESVSRSVLLVLGAAIAAAQVQAAEPATSARQVATTHTVSIPVEGMSCSACAAKIKRTAREVKGVNAVEMDLATRSIRVTYVEGETSPQQIAAAISAIGYKTGTPQLAHGK